jgi:mannose-6-phosphate isomerase-like protein (cupin superfamily)
MAHVGSTITNPASGETCKWHLTAASTNGRLVRAEFWVRPGGGVPAMHIHPRAEERFEVLGGRMTLRDGDRSLALEPGDQHTVRPGVPHAWHNDGDQELHFFVEASPAGRFEDVVEAAFAVGRAARADGRDRPGLLQLAITFAAFRDEVVVTSPPRWLQPLAFAVLVPLARATGHRPIPSIQR